MTIKFKQDEVFEVSHKKTGNPESNIIIFTSAKGGSGCSFLASTVAEYMAQRTTLNVLFLDMNIGRMDSRIIFGIDGPAVKDLGDLPERIDNLDTLSLKKLIVNQKDSLNIILPPLNMECPPILKNTNLDILIESLRDHFDIICIDMPGYLLGQIDMAEIDISDRIVFVSLPDLFSVSNIRILMDYVKDYRSCYDFYLVINKYNMRSSISSTGLSNILRYPITSFIPYDRDIEELVNTRGPGHIFKYKLKVVRNISGLAEKIFKGLEV